MKTTMAVSNKSDNRSEPKAPKTANYRFAIILLNFDLRLDIYALTSGKGHENGIIPPENNHLWMAFSTIAELGQPTLFAKVVKLMK